ncbi:hypothetical protein PBI_TRISCUIT_92 [Microbacterium phage Triscuit]|nr:hypothetical protein PBI_TRISCUIT_92 [Microbacterium phage Triscuit]
MTDVGLISIHELLDDERYRKYFETAPELPEHYYNGGHEPWRLMVLIKGKPRWASKRYASYDEAAERLIELLPKITNGTVNNPALNFMPPIRHARVKNRIDPKTKKPLIISRVWVPQLSGEMPQHHWCGYCRRPTIFAHKAMPAKDLGDFRLPASQIAYRCTLCGANAELMDIRRPELNQRWDTNRPPFFHG